MKKAKTWGDVVREYVPDATDKEVDFILWEYTCYPQCPEETIRKQLKHRYPSRKDRFLKWIKKFF